MSKKKYRPEEIIRILREAEVMINQGVVTKQACRELGITDQTFYRWRKEYGGLKIEQVKRLKDLEIENARLKRLVADLSLDNQILKEVSRGNF